MAVRMVETSVDKMVEMMADLMAVLMADTMVDVLVVSKVWYWAVLKVAQMVGMTAVLLVERKVDQKAAQ